MTLTLFSSLKRERTDKERYYIAQFDGCTYQIIDSVENREICVCTNYDNWGDARERADKIVKLLNASNEKTLS